jgi:hypothetical protein
MGCTLSAKNHILEEPDATFWQSCRQKGAELNIPAWMLAEDGFRHEQKTLRKPIAHNTEG